MCWLYLLVHLQPGFAKPGFDLSVASHAKIGSGVVLMRQARWQLLRPLVIVGLALYSTLGHGILFVARFVVSCSYAGLQAGMVTCVTLFQTYVRKTLVVISTLWE